MPPKEAASWPPKVQAELTRLSDRRASAKSKLAIAIEDRDEGLQELAQMGPEPTMGEKAKCADVVHALLEIKYQRVVIEKCANGIDKVIQDAKQSRFEFAENDTDIPTKQLFLADLAGTNSAPTAKKKDDPGKDDAKALEPTGEGPNQHLKTSVKDLDMPEKLIGMCVKGGYATVGKLIVAFNTGADLGKDLEAGQNQIAAIKRAVTAFQKAHDQAQDEAEDAAKAAATS